MKDIVSLIAKATLPDIAQKHEAFGELVGHFQDMVYGCAYARLGDFQLAEDAAQETFITAYGNLRKLRDAEAFPAWLKRITLTQCNRMTRRKSLPTETLETALDVSSDHSDPAEMMLEKEMSDSVLMAVQALPENERVVTTLFYISGYSQNEIASFLEIPMTAVNSRLHRSRKRLKERMIPMVQENLREKRLSKDETFVNSVLEGVPRVSYRKPDGGWEFTPFASWLRSGMEVLGEDYTYEYIMGTSGAAFRLMWAPGVWDFGNVDIMVMAEDTLEPIRRAFEAVGYGHEVIAKSQADSVGEHSWAAEIIRSSAIGVDGRTADKAGFKRCIIESIQNAGRPVLAFGVVGPPECCIITGYDEDSDALIGWSFFQDKSEAYFRKSDWYADTCGLILIGEKRQVPSLSELHQSSLEWALIKALGDSRVKDRFNGGPSAYTAWAEDIMRGENFSPDDLGTLRRCLTSHYDAMSMLAERNYAANFLRQIANHEPNMAQDLEKAAKCLEDAGSLVSKMHEATGGHIPGDDHEKLKKLADPVIRRQIADAILEARDKHTEAAHHIEQALAK